MKKIAGLGIMILSVVLIAAGCGRDTSTVDSALNGHWELTEANVNGRPLEEVTAFLEETFGTEGTVETPEEEADFYFDDGELIIVDAEGEQTQLTYEVTNTDEENDTINLETSVSTEDFNADLDALGTFSGQEREFLELNATLNNVTFTPQADGDQSAIEEGIQELGEEITREYLQNLEIQLSLTYVDDTRQPEAQAQ